MSDFEGVAPTLKSHKHPSTVLCIPPTLYLLRDVLWCTTFGVKGTYVLDTKEQNALVILYESVGPVKSATPSSLNREQKG
jgi:hypothetical protein